MSKHSIEKVRNVVQEASVYCSSCDVESIRIDYVEEEYFVGVGEESDLEYKIYFKDVDLDKDTFYKLVAIQI